MIGTRKNEIIHVKLISKIIRKLIIYVSMFSTMMYPTPPSFCILHTHECAVGIIISFETMCWYVPKK